MSKYEPAHLAVAHFFKLLGSPAEHEKDFEPWLKLMRECMGTTKMHIDEMKQFIKWALAEDKFSREYITIAKNPMVTFHKNLNSLLKYWRVKNPPIDPDPLWKTVVIPAFDNGDKELVQQHLRRKPKTVEERKELLYMREQPGKSKSYFNTWLAQDNCPLCQGKGWYKARKHPGTKAKKKFWQEYAQTCECIFKEELL